MTHPLDDLIDKMMAAAVAKGEFDNLPGAGQPLDLDTQAKNPLLHRMMTEAQAKHPVVTLKSQIAAAQKALAETPSSDTTTRRARMKHLADLQTRLAIEIEAHGKYG